MPSGTPRWCAVAVLIGLATAAQSLELVDVLRYERGAIAAGHWWRLLTGHLVHLNAMHLVLNALGLVLVAALVGPYMRLAAWGLVFSLSALTTAAGLWLAAPGLTWYVGLSGVLHGVLVAGAIAALTDRRERLFAAALLALVGGKLGWEQVGGPLPGTSAAAGGRVVVDAHLYGALGGIAAALLRSAWRHRPGARHTPGR